MPQRRRGFKVSSTKLKTRFGDFDFYCFSWGKHEEDNVLCQLKRPYPRRPLVRIQSACYTAEIFRSSDCDCHQQLERSLRRISREGGVFIYMLCDGRGAGLYKKVLGLELGRVKGLDTSDAYRHLGLKQDPRDYARVVQILKHWEIDGVRLLTNNPRKINGLQKAGISVSRESLEIPATPASRGYLRTKGKKMGHMLRQFQTKKLGRRRATGGGA